MTRSVASLRNAIAPKGIPPKFKTTVAAALLAVALAALFGAPTPATAQTYPWCAIYTGSMGGSSNCGFSTFQQCLNTVQGIGGFCQRNNWYQAPATTSRRSRRQNSSSQN